MSNMIHFFATRDDLLELLAEIESARRIHYVEAGMFETAELTVYPSAFHIPDLGLINVHSTVLGLTLLIADVTTCFTCERVPQRRGGVRYTVYQDRNPDTISLRPGGQFDEQTILAGDFGTCTDSPVSAALLRAVARAVRKKWGKAREYWVSQGASAILDDGGRLTADLHSPAEYDLRRQ